MTFQLHLKPIAKENHIGFKSGCGKLKNAEVAEAVIDGKMAATPTLNAEEDMNIDIIITLNAAVTETVGVISSKHFPVNKPCVIYLMSETRGENLKKKPNEQTNKENNNYKQNK